MKNEFVTYNQAIALKELGFDEDCLGRYEGKCTSISKPIKYEFTFANLPMAENKVGYPNYPYQDIEAPTKHQAFEYFRKKHDLHVTINRGLKGYYGLLSVKEGSSYVNKWIHKESEFVKSFEEAENDCIDSLIELVKGK